MSQGHELVAQVVSTWLSAEAVNADRGRNAYMDDVAGMQRCLQLPPGASGNVLAAKTESHHSRFPRFLEAHVLNPDIDFAAGRVVLGGLMFASGGRRWELLLTSHDADTYYASRYQPFDISIGSIAQRAYRPPDVDDYDAALAVFEREALAANNAIYRLNSRTLAWAGRNQLPIGGNTQPVTWQRKVQKMGVELTIGLIGLLSVSRGGLPHVPLLEPKSVTDAGVYYPFRGLT